ncbi:MAG: hypothetical protein NZM00_03800 [Anaerolinea sp.]|nr:hypothetical protein [Anaerolinea sp.]
MTANTPQSTVYDLDVTWMVEYFELHHEIGEWAASANPVPSLRAWRFSGRYDDQWAAWLTTRFDLPPILDTCMRYELRIEAAPNPVIVFVNGRRLGKLTTFPIAIDITDFVTYEDNQIGISVGCDTPGQFGTVAIVGIPCEG